MRRFGRAALVENTSSESLHERMTLVATRIVVCWDALTKIALTLASGCYALGRRKMMPERVHVKYTQRVR